MSPARADDHLADVFAEQSRRIRELRELLGPPGYHLAGPYERPKLHCHCQCPGCRTEPERRWHCLDSVRGCGRRF